MSCKELFQNTLSNITDVQFNNQFSNLKQLTTQISLVEEQYEDWRKQLEECEKQLPMLVNNIR